MVILKNQQIHDKNHLLKDLTFVLQVKKGRFCTVYKTEYHSLISKRDGTSLTAFRKGGGGVNPLKMSQRQCITDDVLQQTHKLYIKSIMPFFSK